MSRKMLISKLFLDKIGKKLYNYFKKVTERLPSMQDNYDIRLLKNEVKKLEAESINAIEKFENDLKDYADSFNLSLTQNSVEIITVEKSLNDDIKQII